MVMEKCAYSNHESPVSYGTPKMSCFRPNWTVQECSEGSHRELLFKNISAMIVIKESDTTAKKVKTMADVKVKKVKQHYDEVLTPYTIIIWIPFVQL